MQNMRWKALCLSAFLGLALGLAAGPAAQGAPASSPLERLKDPRPSVRIDAAKAIGGKGLFAHTPELAALLRDPDPAVREAAHAALWQIWMRSGNPELDRLMARGVARMETGDLRGAILDFAEIIRRDRGFPEGWNKRATAYYLAGKYRESIADCRQVLSLNPFHVGALFGLGLNYVGLGDLENAVEAFERTLAVHPYSEGARRYIGALQEALRKQREREL
ncbi:MAG: tetratricopeptide repeat protein [bacterium]|nr:tetratricopeptide repeat protein [bacterium]